MASIVLRDVEFYWAKLGAPVNPFNADYPHWEIQIRTRDKSQADEWKKHGLTVKLEEDDSGNYYRVNLKRKAFTKDGEKRDPARVVDAGLNPIEPDTVGNGSQGHIQLDTYNFKMNNQERVGFSVRGLQVTRYVKYEGSGMQFEVEGETEVVVPDANEGDDIEW